VLDTPDCGFDDDLQILGSPFGCITALATQGAVQFHAIEAQTEVTLPSAGLESAASGRVEGVALPSWAIKVGGKALLPWLSRIKRSGRVDR